MDFQEAKVRMEEGRLYLPDDEEIRKIQSACMEVMYEYNTTRSSESKRREELLKKMLAEVGEGCYIEAPFYATGEEAMCILERMYMSILILPLWTTGIFMWATV